MNHWFRDVGAWRHGHERRADIKKSIFDAKKRSMGKEWEGSVGKEGTFTRAGTAKCIGHHPPLSNMTTSNNVKALPSWKIIWLATPMSNVSMIQSLLRGLKAELKELSQFLS